jgi:hypothetical protein
MGWSRHTPIPKTKPKADSLQIISMFCRILVPWATLTGTHRNPPGIAIRRRESRPHPPPSPRNMHHFQGSHLGNSFLFNELQKHTIVESGYKEGRFCPFSHGFAPILASNRNQITGAPFMRALCA